MKNRIKSFLWRLSAYVGVSAIAWASANLGILELNAEVTTVLALILGEITKALNSKTA